MIINAWGLLNLGQEMWKQLWQPLSALMLYLVGHQVFALALNIFKVLTLTSCWTNFIFSFDSYKPEWPVWPDVILKSIKLFPKVVAKVAKTMFTLKVTLFNMAQKGAKYLGFFCKWFCLHNILKAAHSGHTETYPRRWIWKPKPNRKLFCINWRFPK